MSRFAPGASFAVVAQKDGSFAVEVHEPKRAVPLRITGYASEAEAMAAIAGFTAPKPADPVAPAKPIADVAALPPAEAAEDKRDHAAVPKSKKAGAAPAKSLRKKRHAATTRKAVSKRRRPRG